MNLDVGDGFIAIAVLCFLFFVIQSDDAKTVAVSCNHLKAAAVAASQPVPECAK
jgi:hypothetical protein